MKKLPPIFRARMNVDTCRRVRQLRNYARQQRQLQKIQFVREPMMGEPGNAGIAEAYLFDAARRGVALVGRLDVAFEQRAHARQAFGKFARYLERGLRKVRIALRRRELQLAFHLMK